MQGLEHQHPELQHDVERPTSTFAKIARPKRGLQINAEHLEIDGRA